ncbi:clarin-3 [Mugil cephalus]|uniref:clarin-3 n=1 Tax=Mugil cephalus TaxID=48193 RepID=UPI001FB6F038|nr:clarin-3 [Mugil cephalus]
MPSLTKILYYLGSALATAIAVGIIGYGMSQQWSETAIRCSGMDTVVGNGSAVVMLKLFRGSLQRFSCPHFGTSENFDVIPRLLGSTTPVVLHSLVLFLLVLSLVCSAITILVSLYNSVSNPYETYMGPTAIYVCSSLSACLSVLGLILFAVNISATDMAEELAKSSTGSLQVTLHEKSTQMLLGFYLVIPYTVLSLVAILLIYLYDHAAYTQRTQQQRPTQDAPKEIMMY